MKADEGQFSVHEFEKLGAVVNGACLSILLVLYALLARDMTPSLAVMLLAVLIITTIQIVITFLWTRKGERILLESGAKIWTLRRMSMFLSLSFGCTLVGIIAIAAFRSIDVAELMIVVLSFYFSTNLGRLVKISIKYKRSESISS